MTTPTIETAEDAAKPIRNCHTCAHWDGRENYAKCYRVGTYCEIAMEYGRTPCKPQTLDLWEPRPNDATAGEKLDPISSGWLLGMVIGALISMPISAMILVFFCK